jgi:phage/plasmid primase-like uncharacterized protein
MPNYEKPGVGSAGLHKYSYSNNGASRSNSQDFLAQVHDGARHSGFDDLPLKLEDNGKVHRFGKKGERWYILHADGRPYFICGSWRTGQRFELTARGQKLNAEERARVNAEINAAKAKRQSEKQAGHTRAAEQAARILEALTPAREDYPYLLRKAIPADELLQHGDELFIPMYRDDNLVGGQLIDADGNKRYLSGTPKSAAYARFGEIKTGEIAALCEGVATGLSIRAAMGCTVIVAFDCHNLLAVAKAFESSPAIVTVAADDDWKRVNTQTGEPENIGLIKAREAAAAIGAKLAVPDFGEHRSEKDTDFNDLAASEGPEAVRRCIEAAEHVKQTPDKDEGLEEAPKTEAAYRAAVRKKYRFHGDEAPPVGPDLIKGMLPSNGNGLLNGQSGAGKTFIVVDLASALATSGEFFGKAVRTRVGTVIIAAEGGGRFHRRIDACLQHRRVSEIQPIAYLPFSGNLNDDDEFEELLSELPVIDAIFRDEHDVRLGLVVLDTMSSSFVMKDQNNAAEVTAICKRLKQIGEKVKLFALGVHHLGKDETRDAAGSFAWRANVDVMFSAIATGDRVRGVVNRREFCISKGRDAAEGPISDCSPRSSLASTKTVSPSNRWQSNRYKLNRPRSGKSGRTRASSPFMRPLMNVPRPNPLGPGNVKMHRSLRRANTTQCVTYSLSATRAKGMRHAAPSTGPSEPN